MSSGQLSRRHRMLVHCAPITDERVDDRALRVALHRARKTEEFALQQDFDKAAAALVYAIPIPNEITEWMPTETFVAPPRRDLRDRPASYRHGDVWSPFVSMREPLSVQDQHFVDCAGSGRRPATDGESGLAVVRVLEADSVKTDAGALGDFFFMKHRLAHYDVPPEFADLKTLGCRVFDDEEGQRVAQVWVVEKKMQFFLFPAERDPKTGKAREFSGWRHIDQERWAAVVKEQNGVCFMAALRGSDKDLAPYVSKKKE